MQEQNSYVWLQSGFQLPFILQRCSQHKTGRYCSSSVRHTRTHMTRLHSAMKRGTTIRAPQGSHWPAGEYTSDKKKCCVFQPNLKLKDLHSLPPVPRSAGPIYWSNPPTPTPRTTHRTHFLRYIHHFCRLVAKALIAIEHNCSIIQRWGSQ